MVGRASPLAADYPLTAPMPQSAFELPQDSTYHRISRYCPTDDSVVSVLCNPLFES